jgi:hypothetical protein
LAAFAPGVFVVGIIISAMSFNKLISDADNTPAAASGFALQPLKKADDPIIVPPSNRATLDKASLLFMVID